MCWAKNEWQLLLIWFTEWRFDLLPTISLNDVYLFYLLIQLNDVLIYYLIYYWMTLFRTTCICWFTEWRSVILPTFSVNDALLWYMYQLINRMTFCYSTYIFTDWRSDVKHVSSHLLNVCMFRSNYWMM